MGGGSHEESDAELARRLQGEEVRDSANVSNLTGSSSLSGTTSGAGQSSDSTSSSQPWAAGTAPPSLFAMSVGTEDGTFGDRCGEFHVGQLVQVNRSDGSWTYGKIISYDAGGDTYSVQTRAGPKHFVERADITDDVVVNPSDGGCAQQ